MFNLFRSKRRRPRVARLTDVCSFDMMEERVLMTATPTGRPTLGADIEPSGPYYVNSWAPMEAAAHGSGSYGYDAWQFFEFGPSSAVFGSNAGASTVNSVSLQLYNTATSGNYQPYAGSFSIYVIPNDSVSYSSMQFQSGQVGVNSLGTSSGGPSTLGITGNAADWLVGTYNVTSGLTLGNHTFTGSTTGSTADGNGDSGSTATLGSLAAQTIAADLNNGTPFRLAVVANDTSVAVDWEGNYSSNYPQLTLDTTQIPKVNIDQPSYTVNEADQNPSNTTPLTFTIDRTANPSTTTTIDWSATNLDVPAGGFSPQSGSVTFNPGETSKTVTVLFNDISTTQNQGHISIALSDPGQSAGDPAPVFPTNGATATGTINFIQAVQVNLSAATMSVNETAGTATFQVSRSGTPAALNSVGTTISYTTADGQPYLTSSQSENNAEAGRDYTATSGTLTWAPGDTSTKTITVPLIDVTTFAGTRYFTLTLSNPSSATALGVSQSVVTITDNAPANSSTTSGLPNYTVPVEVGGPYTPYTNSWNPLNSQVHGSFGYADMPLYDFSTATPGVYPAANSVGTVDSIRLSIYNTATTGGYGGTPGSFDVYLLTDNTFITNNLRYGGGTGNTGPSVIGSQASPLYVGTAYFPNNAVGYNDYTLDNLSTAVQNALTADLNNGTEFRLVITPSAGSSVAADWEGNWVQNQPMLTLLTQAPVATQPSWLTPGSAATWNAATHTLNVTGAATIVADPGTDAPNIVANGTAAHLTIAPTTVGFVNLGGVTLTNGASITVPSVGTARTHTNHNVVVIDSTGAAPTFSIDSTSKFDIADNDLIIQNGNLATIQADLNEGRDLAGGDNWTGNGLTSSAAAAAYAANGYEYTTLGMSLNSALPNGAFTSWQAGSSTMALGANDIIIKYTYNGDFTLDGQVNADDDTIFGLFFNDGVMTNTFVDGDTDGNGTVDANDETIFSLNYGLGTHGDQL